MTSMRELGCELGQGFLFARPMSREALFEYLGEQQSNAA
jgi:EAL domain-containing protein (putative c-di-GMP-specific phosphodiesterase class I)